MATNGSGNGNESYNAGGDSGGVGFGSYDHGDRNRNECLASYVDNGSLESKRYYLSRKTVWEMLSDRGYDVPDFELARSLTEFRSVYGEKPDLEQLRICVPLRSNTHKKILVVFMGTEDINIQTIRGLFGLIHNKESLHGLILISQSKMTHFARKELERFPFKVETFQVTDLLVNVSKHFLQPRHEILSTVEKYKLLKKHNLEDKQLPRILATDALTQHYGLEKGQVVKLTYRNEIFDGSFENYRCLK